MDLYIVSHLADCLKCLELTHFHGSGGSVVTDTRKLTPFNNERVPDVHKKVEKRLVEQMAFTPTLRQRCTHTSPVSYM